VDAFTDGDGLFFRTDQYRKKNFAAVTDGLSNTFMVGEDLPDMTHWYAWAHANGASATCAIAPNARRQDGTEYGRWDWPNRYSFHSRHSGGLQFALADGTVRFITDSIDLSVYRAMATIRGGEAVSAP
jgi:hypothetical protein